VNWVIVIGVLVGMPNLFAAADVSWLGAGYLCKPCDDLGDKSHSS